MIRNYLIEIDETHINFDDWYICYANTTKHRTSNATIDKKITTKQKNW